MTANTIAQALTEICLVYTDVYGADNIDLPNKAFAEPDDAEIGYARMILSHTDMGQSSLSDATGFKLWERSGLGVIELYTPIGAGIVDAYNAAEEVVKLYQNASTPSGVWFRNVRLEDRSPNGLNPSPQRKRFHLDVEFTFEYNQRN